MLECKPIAATSLVDSGRLLKSPIARVNQHPPAHHEGWDGKWPRNSFLLASSSALAKSGWLARLPFLVPTY